MTTPQNASPITPDTPPLETIAAQLLSLVTQMEAIVPDLQPHDRREVGRVSASAKFADLLIAPTITTVTSVPSVPRDLFKVERAQEALQYRDQLRPIAQRLEALTQGLDFTIDTKLSVAGEDALQTYHWAKRAATGPDGAALHPYLDEMRRVVKKALNRHPRKPAGESPTVPPSTPPSPQGQTFMSIRPPSEADDSSGELPDSFYKAGEDDT